VDVAYVGVGANLGDREDTIRRAVELLRGEAGIDVAGVSSLIETEPWGYTDQPAFLNGVLELRTSLPPRRLLDVLLDVEQRLGRRRDAAIRYGPRAIDHDLLLYGEQEVREPGLTVPHPRLHEREFALRPLLELAPGLVIPGRGAVGEVLAALHSDA
jgi:2-amino-4-hydroxy-6-hydroxymethyldihydropteridine diphosphokinase